MSEREILLKKISTYKFAINDLNLFLDTHPGDTETLKKREEFQLALKPLVEEYEARFQPLTKSADTGNTWAWVRDPWPWERVD